MFFGANVPLGVATDLGKLLGMLVVENPSTYLGVPAIWGRSKKRGLAYMKGRILGKLQGWKQNTLSRAGREVLIKAVVQAIPSYPMSIFKFSAIVCHELDALIASFCGVVRGISGRFIGCLKRFWVFLRSWVVWALKTFKNLMMIFLLNSVGVWSWTWTRCGLML